jgi:lysozyme family protein
MNAALPGGFFASLTIGDTPMAASSYDECLRRLLIHEGGYSNHPADPGGPTNFGITLADYRRYVKPSATAADVKAMTVDEAKAIYRAKYWDAQRCDALPAGVDDTVFDYGVNSGIGRCGKVLRRVLGLSDASSAVTDEVIAALGKRDPKVVIAAINDERLAFLKSLKTWPVFGVGWGRRVAEVRVFSLALAGAGAQDMAASSPRQAAGKGAIRGSLPRQGSVIRAGTLAAAGSAGLGHWLGAHPLLVAALAAAGLAIVAAVLCIVNRRHQSQQEAPVPGMIPVPAQPQQGS